MSIIRVSKTPNQFSIIDRTPAEDPRLSFKAKGIMFYLLTKPDDWTIRVTDLVNRSADGKDSVYSGMKELEKTGYIERKPVRGEAGQFEGYEYVVYENPISPLPENPDTVKKAKKQPLTENPDTAYPDSEKPDISNNHLTDNNFEEEEEVKTAVASSVVVPFVPIETESEKEFKRLAQAKKLSPAMIEGIRKKLQSKYTCIDDYSPEAIRRTFKKLSRRPGQISHVPSWFAETVESDQFAIMQEREAKEELEASRRKYGF